MALSTRGKLILVTMSMIATGVVLFIGLVLYVGAAMDATAMCAESQVARFPSPENRTVATVYVRSCGATTDYATHVNLHRSEDTPRPNAAGVISDGEVLLETGERYVVGKWDGEKHLTLTVKGGAAPVIGSADRTWNAIEVRIVK